MRKIFIFISIILVSGCKEIPKDCAGVENGSAITNELGFCVEGNTGLHKNFHGFIEDVDGNKYTTVKIGNQIWMSENLRTKHYNNGDDILLKYSDEKLGGFYTWHSAERNICPEGWHVPTIEEFETLIKFSKEDGNKSVLKTGKNTSGFSAIESGYVQPYDLDKRRYETDSYYWSSSTKSQDFNMANRLIIQHWSIDSFHIPPFLGWRNVSDKDNGFCVRCIKN